MRNKITLYCYKYCYRRPFFSPKHRANNKTQGNLQMKCNIYPAIQPASLPLLPT